ncbi:hypothetical protein RSP_0068 [Pseudomonas phage RSP]|nr:hypothetical protein RSP_0068 [Pseudomonas phage RSP]
MLVNEGKIKRIVFEDPTTYLLREELLKRINEIWDREGFTYSEFARRGRTALSQAQKFRDRDIKAGTAEKLLQVLRDLGYGAIISVRPGLCSVQVFAL